MSRADKYALCTAFCIASAVVLGIVWVAISIVSSGTLPANGLWLLATITSLCGIVFAYLTMRESRRENSSADD